MSGAREGPASIPVATRRKACPHLPYPAPNTRTHQCRTRRPSPAPPREQGFNHVESGLKDQAGGSYIEVVADLVAAYVSNNAMRASDLPEFIASIHASIQSLAKGQVEAAPPAPLVPAVPVKKSLTSEHIICLEDGKRFKMIKRYLQRVYGLTPEEYRAKWGLAADHPVIAPAYSA